MAQGRGKWLSSDPVGRAVASDAVGRRGPTQVAGQGVAKVTQSGSVTQPHRVREGGGVGETHIVLRLDRRRVGEGNSQPSSLYKLIFVCFSGL